MSKWGYFAIIHHAFTAVLFLTFVSKTKKVWYANVKKMYKTTIFFKYNFFDWRVSHQVIDTLQFNMINIVCINEFLKISNMGDKTPRQ